MTHELTRLVRAYGAQPWLIEPSRAAQIIEAIEFRASSGIAASAARKDNANAASGAQGRSDDVAPQRDQSSRALGVINLMGTIMPRVAGADAMSGDFASLAKFQAEFEQMAAREDLGAIVLNIDSPGGQIDQTPETAHMIRAARREGRPIVAVANTMAASAAYWIAAAADEISVSPSGVVGSIGVYTVHQDISEALAKKGVKASIISAGPRKIEGHPFGPLDATARAELSRQIEDVYGMFTGDVAAWRAVDLSVVRADPEETEAHFGGGRAYRADQAVALGMADRVETLSQAIRRLQAPRPATASQRRRRLALI